MKFMFVFEKYLSTIKLKDISNNIPTTKLKVTDNKNNEQNQKMEELLVTLVDSLSRMVSLEFLKVCNSYEIQNLFYSIWNVAFEAR